MDNLSNLGYSVNWQLLDSKDFGLAQTRKRVFISGHLNFRPNIVPTTLEYSTLNDILEKSTKKLDSTFIDKLLKNYHPNELKGKSIKDKRGGQNNIHSWDIELKGHVSNEQKELLDTLFKERRRKKWAEEIGIDWMDGMPLTLKQISTFSKISNLEDKLDDLVKKGYLRFEYPKQLIEKNGYKKRIYDESKSKGYNIVSGKLSFEINKILDPNDIAPTIVATDVSKIAVCQDKHLRRLTKREGLRLFGFPESYMLNVNEKESFDLLGNTIAVPLVSSVSKSLINNHLDLKISQSA